VRAQLDECGTPAATGGGEPGLGDVPEGDEAFQLGEQARAGHLEPVAEFGAGHRALVPEQPQKPYVQGVDRPHRQSPPHRKSVTSTTAMCVVSDTVGAFRAACP